MPPRPVPDLDLMILIAAFGMSTQVIHFPPSPCITYSELAANIQQYGNPELNGGGGWGIFNAILGWQNSATYGSVIGYNMYWLAVIVGFVLLRFQETKGHLPFMKSKRVASQGNHEDAVVGKERSSVDKVADPAQRTVSDASS